MTNLSKEQIEQAKKLSNLTKIAQILDNIRNVIAKDKLQKQPLILRINENFIFDIARKAIALKDSTFVLAIAGESASGKTTLVRNAAKACLKSENNHIYTTICCDDYYKDASKELLAAGSYEKLFESGFSFDTPDAIDIELMKKHLIELKNGREIHSPLYNFVTCESKLDTVLKKPAKLILNEGLYVLHDIVREVADVKIYVYTPFEIIKDRWFARAASRGKTGMAAQMQFHDVNQTAFRYIRPTMDLADVVINGMTSQEYIEDFVRDIINAIVSVVNDESIAQ